PGVQTCALPIYPDRGQQQGQWRGALAVAQVVTDLIVQLLQPRRQPLAQQHRDGGQRQDQGQPADIVLQRQQQAQGLPERLQILQLGQGPGRQAEQPVAVDRRVAGHPEQLVINGLTQFGAQLQQLVLIDLQRHGLAEQGVDMGAELFDQYHPTADQLLQILAQGLALFLRQLAQQPVEIGLL